MSRLLAKIMLALLMLPVAAVIYSVTVVGTAEVVFGYSDFWPFITANVVTAAFVAGYWIMLWRRTVNWTGERVAGSIGGAMAAVVLGVIVGAILAATEDTFGVFVGGVTAILGWLLATTFVWRETAAERASRVKSGSGVGLACPRCGYNMTGLSESTCPECGAAFTIDELVAQQRGQEQSEIDH